MRNLFRPDDDTNWSPKRRQGCSRKGDGNVSKRETELYHLPNGSSFYYFKSFICVCRLSWTQGMIPLNRCLIRGR